MIGVSFFLKNGIVSGMESLERNIKNKFVLVYLYDERRLMNITQLKVLGFRTRKKQLRSIRNSKMLGWDINRWK